MNSIPRRRPSGITRPRPAAPTQDEPTEPATHEHVLYTADQAAELLQIRPSWLRRKAAARAVPCRYVGKHLRFTRSDILAIAELSAQPTNGRRNI
jgi:hypothetical protein